MDDSQLCQVAMVIMEMLHHIQENNVESPDSRMPMTFGGNRAEGGINFSSVMMSLYSPNSPWNSPHNLFIYSSIINLTPVVWYPFTPCFIRASISACIGC